MTLPDILLGGQVPEIPDPLARRLASGVNIRIARAIRDALLRNDVETWLVREVDAVLERVYREIAADVAAIEGAAATPALQRQMVNALSVTVNEKVAAAYVAARRITMQELPAFALIESDWAAIRLVQTVGNIVPPGVRPRFTLLSPERVRAIAAFPVEGLPLGDWWDGQGAEMLRRVRSTVQGGVARGEGPREIARKIAPVVQSESAAGTLLGQARRRSELLVRTAVTSINTTARFETLAAQDRRVTGRYRYIATKDARTSAVCRALDGKEWSYDDPEGRRPPQHINCRSSIIPVIDWAALGVDPPPPDDETGVLGIERYETWLARQDEATQRTILGKSRWELWKDGRARLDDFVAPHPKVDGALQHLPLSQLRARLGLPERGQLQLPLTG